MSAHAATPIACDITGTTTQLTPIPPPPVTGGGGTFSFGGSATCLLGTKKHVSAVSASGTYTNTICGTGSAKGTATFGDPSITAKGFNINFVLGNGALKVSSGGTGAGAVNIVPKPTLGCSKSPVTGFNITATIAGTQ
jgi:hypothetical protein